MSHETVRSIAAHVFSKKTGEFAAEAGAVGLTLLCLCESHGVSAEREESAEFQRVRTIGKAEFRDRQNEKARCGVALETRD